MPARTVRLLCLLLLVGAGSWLRLVVVEEYHAPAGDGLEYHRLAHELRRGHRYAYSPPPAEPSWTRTPGYPLLLAALVERDDKVIGDPEFESSLLRGCRLNVALDAITVVLVFLLALESGLGGGVAWTAAGLTAFCPLLWLSCCYLLRENLTATLTTASMVLLVRALRRRTIAPLAGAVALAGAAALVRSDSLLLLAAFVPAWWGLRSAAHPSQPGPPRDLRLRGAAVAALVLAAVYGPWPVRNLVLFGEPHALGAAWLDVWGNPLPTGERMWARTWVDDQDQGFINLRFAYHYSIAEHHLHPKCMPTSVDREEVLAVIRQYNVDRLSPAVDAAFRDLARRRLAREPLRVLLLLPLRRAFLFLWRFPPAFEYPLQSKLLRQPERRNVFGFTSRVTCLLSLSGFALLCLRRERRALALTFGLAVWLRTLVIATVAPDGGFQRYLAPIYPVILVMAAFAIAGWAGRGQAGEIGRRSTAEGDSTKPRS